MRKIVLFNLFLMLLFGCNRKPEENTEKTGPITAVQKIDFDQGSTPDAFSVKTFDGTVFNSKDNAGKYWVVFIYDRSYLTRSDTYDMVAELNATHKRFGDKIPMIGLVNGFNDDQKALNALLTRAKFTFRQIDNTEGPDKEVVIRDNVVCGPAKIIIDPQGKVIYNGCGGKTETLDLKLEDIIRTAKL